MTISSSETIREGEIPPLSSVPASSSQCHVVEKEPANVKEEEEEKEEVAGMAEEALHNALSLNNEEYRLIEEIQNLDFFSGEGEDNSTTITAVAAELPEQDPMIFQPIFYGGIGGGEFTPCETPPEPASDFFFPQQEMASAMGWHHPNSAAVGHPPQMQPYDPEMAHQFVAAYPHGWAPAPPPELSPPGCIPSPVDMSQQNLAFHAYPIFQPIPTFVGQPFFHRRNGCGSAPGTPHRGGGGCVGVGGGGVGGNGYANHTLRECYNCRRPGHLARNCGEVASDKQCFHCLKFGHVVRNCPQTRNQGNNRREGNCNNNNNNNNGDPRMNNSLSSSPAYLEWSSDSGDPASDCNDVSSPCVGSPMPTEFGCFNPTDYDVNPSNARFYIIKSNSEQDIRSSIEHGIWCSTDHGNKKLDNSFKNHQHNGPTILLFSVNNSGKFCGIAEMTSRVDFHKESGVWSNNRFRGQFRVRWTHVKDVPNSALRHIYLANNDFKPVTFSRDTQEVPPREGKRMLYIVHKYCHLSSMLDPINEEDCRHHRHQRSDGEEDDAGSSSLNLEDEEGTHFYQHQRLQHHHHQHQQHLRGGGGGDGGGDMFHYPAAVAYPHFATAAGPHAPFAAPYLPYHIVPYQGVEWSSGFNPHQPQEQQMQQQQPQPLSYPSPLMALPSPPSAASPAAEPVPLIVPQLLNNEVNQEEREKQPQQQHPNQTPSPPQSEQQPHQSHQQQQQQPQQQQPQQQRPQQQQQPSSHQQHSSHERLDLHKLDIINSLTEFPSLPKKAITTPLTALVS